MSRHNRYFMGPLWRWMKKDRFRFEAPNHPLHSDTRPLITGSIGHIYARLIPLFVCSTGLFCCLLCLACPLGGHETSPWNNARGKNVRVIAYFAQFYLSVDGDVFFWGMGYPWVGSGVLPVLDSVESLICDLSTYLFSKFFYFSLNMLRLRWMPAFYTH